MSERKQIPGASMCFTDQEIKILIEKFGCKNMEELRDAAKRYEQLFFMFDHDNETGVGMYPGEDFQMVLTLAEQCVFENFTQTDEPLRRRYYDRPSPKRRPGRARKTPLPKDFSDKLKDARKLVSTNADAAQRLKALGIVPEYARSLKPRTILKYINKAEKEEQEAERERQQLEAERYQRLLDAQEAFKDCAPRPPEELK